MNIPIDNVINLRRQGYSNNQIIEYLQHGGYNYTDIMDAFTQADIKGEVEQTLTNNPNQPQNTMAFATDSVVAKTNQSSQIPNVPPTGTTTIQTPQQPVQEENISPEILEEKIQEVVEAIIDERWEELESNIGKIVEWKNKATIRFEKMEQQFNDLKKNFDTLHESILGKVGDYDKHIADVGTEVKALEKVFQKILPGFVDNVNELSRISKNFKEAANVVKPKSSSKKEE